MLYKTEQIEKDWNFYSATNPTAQYMPFHRLRRVVCAIDDISIAAGCGPITITSFMRQGNPKSYHSKGQAVDIGIHKKPRQWLEAMYAFKLVLSRLNPQMQLVTHLKLLNSPNEHFHLELDDNSL